MLLLLLLLLFVIKLTWLLEDVTLELVIFVGTFTGKVVGFEEQIRTEELGCWFKLEMIDGKIELQLIFLFMSVMLWLLLSISLRSVLVLFCIRERSSNDESRRQFLLCLELLKRNIVVGVSSELFLRLVLYIK